MKKYLHIYHLVIALVLASSCSLDVEPTAFLAPENFYNTPEEVESGVQHMYSTLNFRDYQRPYLTIPILASELASIKEDEPRNPQPLQTFQASASNEQLNDFFRFSYVGINRANTIIANTREVSFNEDLGKKFLGEALFFRAFHHFNLVRLFGEIPLRLKTTESISDARGADFAPIEQVYARIIEDLLEAETLLPIAREAGRADLVAAQSLLAKVYITMASSAATGRPEFDFIDNPEEYYALASAAASSVVNDQTEYTFEEDLLEVYNVLTRDGVNGSEHIFFINFSRDDATNEIIGSKTGLFFWPAIGTLGGSGGTCGTELFSSDGRSVFNGFGVFRTEPGFLDTFDPTDRRRTELFIDELFDGDDNSVWTASFSNPADVPFSAKYLDICANEFTQTRPMVLRFSDILLVYAEAQGPTTEGYAAVNKIRTRAGLPDLDPGLSVTEFRDRIIQERSWELAFEGKRFYDLRRTNSVESAFEAVGQSNLLIGQETLYEYPKPDQETNLNPNN